MSNLSAQEKIDYIYNHIKKEEKRLLFKRIYKFLVYLFFIWYILYFYLYWFEKLKNSIIQSIKPSINSDKIINWLEKNSWKIIEKIKQNLNKKNNEEY